MLNVYQAVGVCGQASEYTHLLNYLDFFYVITHVRLKSSFMLIVRS